MKVTPKTDSNLDEISLMTDVKNVATQDKVILSTYHQVKGLELKRSYGSHGRGYIS